MIDTRVSLALNGGGLSWPAEGRLAVFQPDPASQLPGVSQDRAQIIADFKPDVDRWQARGYDCVVAAEGACAAALVAIPRAKTAARAMIAQAARMAQGVVVIDGQKTDGIDSLLRDIRKRTTVHGPVTKAHGKLFWCPDCDAQTFHDWARGPELTEGGFWTAPGVFSADAVDPASALLADALPQDMGARVADLGAGWGALSAHVLVRPEVREVHLVEAGHMALECARRNVTDPRAQFHWADATTWRPAERLDAVVMNPPFHSGRDADPTLGQAFVQAAARMLRPQGHLWMVANRHLPYETALQGLFATVTELDGDRRFKLFHASRPRRKGGRPGQG